MIAKLREKHYAITYLTSSELVREFMTWTIDSKKSPSDNFLAIYTVRTKAHRHCDSSSALITTSLSKALTSDVCDSSSKYDSSKANYLQL
jgi:hypothetical protein